MTNPIVKNGRAPLDAHVLERVYAARKALGWTRRELARRSGISEMTLCNLDLGRRAGFKLDEVEKIADALGISPADLVGDVPLSLQVSVTIEV